MDVAFGLKLVMIDQKEQHSSLLVFAASASNTAGLDEDIDSQMHGVELSNLIQFCLTFSDVRSLSLSISSLLL